MRTALQPITAGKPPLQLNMALEALELTGINAVERRSMILRLAHVILEAAGIEVEEISDDGR
jgi:hypothetical protein